MAEFRNNMSLVMLFFLFIDFFFTFLPCVSITNSKGVSKEKKRVHLK